MVNPKKIAIVGAGIAGINTALELQRLYPDFELTIIADKFNSETLSDGAAGLFRPETYCFGPSFDISQEWINDAYNFYKNLLNTEPCGINEISGYTFSKKKEFTENHYLKKCLPTYRDATDEELLQHSTENSIKEYGSFCTSIVIECKRFLPWALKKITNNGGNVIERKIHSFDEICDDFDFIFNCAGLEAARLCDDKELVPIRGQILRVKAPWVDKFYYDDFDTYIIPSIEDGTVVLGGCRHFGSHDVAAQQRDTDTILENCIRLVPSLKEALKSEYKVWVGLRPYRSRVRIEAEKIKSAVVIHHYGHGGYGVTLGPGTAKYAVKLLLSYL
ncbi:D-aspartate oxidase-like [Adelges cooleyi]|uniref:D-aspartate oxidase-like n=1 Tax=Adelges cooleyi TaxID=133065 RepID=UPI00218072D9|nr:D-aspartate oxidase-like [Adelges cooleyi]XP_050422326.1 D-aspartate oxidase-like [Adelges cooleyi]